MADQWGDSVTLYDERLKIAKAIVEAETQPALRRLRGEPGTWRTAKGKRKAKLADPIRQKRRPGTWNPGDPPVGAEWFFARWCALECLHLWDAPEVVRDYLETGNPEIAMDPAEAEKTVGTPAAGAPRKTPAGEAKWWTPKPGQFGVTRLDPAAESARMSAMYAASGNIAGAVEYAIRALAWAARKTAEAAFPEATVDTLTEAFLAAKANLESIFATKALEIYRGEDE